MIDDVEEAILKKGLTAPRITKESIEKKIVETKLFKLTDVLTVCVLTLENGFTVTGESACASPSNYNREIGEKIARDNAVEKIWILEGYLLKEKLYQDSKPMKSSFENNARLAMQEFVNRVDAGEVRTSYTYKKFKDILS